MNLLALTPAELIICRPLMFTMESKSFHELTYMETSLQLLQDKKKVDELLKQRKAVDEELKVIHQ